jgi:hypothetical protein
MACLCNGGLFPRLFFTQSAVALPVPIVAAAVTSTPVLTLEPIATLSGDEVKLDSTVELQFALPNSTIASTVTGVTYRLERSTNGGAFTPIATLDLDLYLSSDNVSTTPTLIPNLTWVDVPGVGTQIYRVVIETNGPVIAGRITSITAETRALNALVVREA